ncbi:MAG: DUF1080 domain-containing protein [Chlorobi bacterium]|nr:DUF1080 domain-containing protein [Chlorobiota bacterium]
MEWENLFDGKTLDGWEQKGGEAQYKVEDGMIVGVSKADTPNSFLCTKQKYSNFILEVEFLVDDRMNSGIQIRSNSFEEYRNGRVHGYQVEIDPSNRAWSAGIYDEARRGWLYDMKNNEAARNAFKHGEWNKYHIEAIGNSIRTWINGVPAANLEDSMTKEGFIALQVHGTKESGIEVKWRNIRILDLGTTNEFPQKIISGGVK